MQLTVNRIKSNDETTIGLLYIDGIFECFTLEDEFRLDKKMNETRIPQGQYKVKLRTHGGFHNRYSDKFPSFHKGMLEISDVKGFTDILIHIGNTEKDTSGCLLVGTGCYSASNDMSIQSSSLAYGILYKKVVDAAQNNSLWIDYLDNDYHSGV